MVVCVLALGRAQKLFLYRIRRELTVAATMIQHCRAKLPWVLCIAWVAWVSRAGLPTLDEAIHSKRDVWGEAAIAQPNGPSYEFFAPLLPPLRYVNADFRYYPIVLSAPNAKVKARLISNGSGVNLFAKGSYWHESSTPASSHWRPLAIKLTPLP